MNMPRSALANTADLPQLSTDLVVPGSSRSGQATLEEALQQAVTQSVEAKVEARLAAVLEGIGDSFYALDRDWRFTYINRAAEVYFGWDLP